MAESFNDFNRELQRRISDPQARYMFGLMYERMVDLSNQNDQMARVLLDMVNNVNRVVQMQGLQGTDLTSLRKQINSEVAGVSVNSESIVDDPEQG